jgi:hypothetical protein
VGIREGPERRPEADRADGAAQVASRLTAVAVDEHDVGADVGVLGDITVVAIANLDLEFLVRDVIEQLLGLGIVAIHQRDDLEQAVEGDGNGRALDREFQHPAVAEPGIVRRTAWLASWCLATW